MDLSLPTVMGMTTPGNKTVFLRGRMGKSSGTSLWSSTSSSSSDISGIKSLSSSIELAIRICCPGSLFDFVPIIYQSPSITSDNLSVDKRIKVRLIVWQLPCQKVFLPQGLYFLVISKTVLRISLSIWSKVLPRRFITSAATSKALSSW